MTRSTALSTAALVLLGAASLGAQSPVSPQSPEARAVLAAVTGFTDALKSKDTTAMLRHIDTTYTRMTLLRPAPGGQGVRVALLTGREFIRVVSQPDQPPLDEPIRNPVIQIDGDLATVWAEYQVRRPDRTVSHCGYDAFQLARLNGTWKILNVSDTFRREGCGPAWP